MKSRKNPLTCQIMLFTISLAICKKRKPLQGKRELKNVKRKIVYKNCRAIIFAPYGFREISIHFPKTALHFPCHFQNSNAIQGAMETGEVKVLKN
jgi:hypothetical protein